VKVILTQPIPNLGDVGDVVQVADGYAVNYLLPRKIAVKADPSKLRQLEHQRRILQKRRERQLAELKELAEKLEETSVTITARAGEEDRLFGSVTNTQIAEALAEQGIRIDKKQIQIDEPIKSLGVYKVAVKLGMGVQANLKLWVIKG